MRTKLMSLFWVSLYGTCCCDASASSFLCKILVAFRLFSNHFISLLQRTRMFSENMILFQVSLWTPSLTPYALWLSWLWLCWLLFSTMLRGGAKQFCRRSNRGHEWANHGRGMSNCCCRIPNFCCGMVNHFAGFVFTNATRRALDALLSSCLF